MKVSKFWRWIIFCAFVGGSYGISGVTVLTWQFYVLVLPIIILAFWYGGTEE